MQLIIKRAYELGRGCLNVVVPLVFLLLLVVITWQVASRYLLNQPSTVTEELGRLLLMWLGVLGSALTWAEKKHIAISLLHDKLPPLAQIWLEKFTYLCTTAFGMLLVIGGVHLSRNAFVLSQTTPAMGLSMGLVYLVVPVGGAFFMLFSLHFFLEPPAPLEATEQTEGA